RGRPDRILHLARGAAARRRFHVLADLCRHPRAVAGPAPPDGTAAARAVDAGAQEPMALPRLREAGGARADALRLHRLSPCVGAPLRGRPPLALPPSTPL